MSYLFLPTGFEHGVRIKLGVSEEELPNSSINSRYISEYAEKIVLSRVPDYATLTDPLDLIELENAIISYVCYLLCPSLNRLLNNEVLTIDVTWKKSKIDWLKMAEHFFSEYEENLSKISTVVVSDYEIGGLANFGGE